MAHQHDNIDELDTSYQMPTTFNNVEIALREPIDEHQETVNKKIARGFLVVYSTPKKKKKPSDKIICIECGKSYTRNHKLRHMDTIYHIEHMNQRPSPPIYSTKRKLSDLYTQPNTTSLFIKH